MKSIDVIGGLRPDTTAESIKKELFSISEVRENPDMPVREWNQNECSLRQDGDEISVMYSGQEIERLKGRLLEMDTLAFKGNVVLSYDNTIGGLSYDPRKDLYLLGKEGIDLIDSNPELIAVGLTHEASHDKYFSLDEASQVEIGRMFLRGATMRKFLAEFAETLYLDPRLINDGVTAGESYLNAQDATAQNSREKLTDDTQIGLKDSTTIVLSIDGEKKEVFLGMLVSELIAYMASVVVGEEAHKAVIEKGKGLRSGTDNRFDIAKKTYQYITADPTIASHVQIHELLSYDDDNFKGKVLPRLRYSAAMVMSDENI